ncbi:methylmalonyl Co-A mutase-associated GTPase MeaB [Nisaea acidiphila]|uniref:Methylmalonyl Co-A mutase-associated GTPase MeaB n=1 Tax=Nisaea acidiphila TaxID=1862145 RepID=A0A9J7ALS4_9PROT|nr:methylmalonyl Co-A mutase-associated GTPase MeaB [Nisaea acidiphila]UUX48424.1 methylmalonyl Co-A mutase-associated GTPase MeaB [Nisaea acidiphila]
MAEPAAAPKRRQMSVDDYVEGVRSSDRAILARAITLIESRNPAHRSQAQEVLNALLPFSGEARRIGITGVPGVGKSTFIEAFGKMLTGAGHKVAVLAVDPSSNRTGGSILGDKTRMQELGRDPDAYIRPSPSAGTLGGVARATRETMVICEAAGFDHVIVETVGVGQSETVVAEMVDFFLVLMLPGAGDELQGIKKGVLEIADMIAVNKADGEIKSRARRAAAEYRRALEIMTPASPNWRPPVSTCSALTRDGLADILAEITRHREILSGTGEFQKKRQEQQVRWMWAMVRERLMARFEEDEAVRRLVTQLEDEVAGAKLTASAAADRLLAAFGFERD